MIDDQFNELLKELNANAAAAPHTIGHLFKRSEILQKMVDSGYGDETLPNDFMTINERLTEARRLAEYARKRVE